jgi:DNA-binding NarL/FixJ family response regulator/signal transduction histidine kinase
MPLGQPRYQLWLACFFIFGVTFGLTPWNEGSARSRRVQLAWLAVQAVTALVMIGLVCTGHEGTLLVLVAAQLGWFMSFRRAFLWVAVQAVLMGVILVLSWPMADVLSLMATYVAFQVLALFSCFLAASEASARSGLASANNELRATGELLANTSRMAERERISRELHDTLGHHLTALSLNLEAASHIAQDNTLVQIHRAQSVTKLLLSDLRDVVSTLRGQDPVPLAQALRTLVAGVPAPQLHLVTADDLAIDDPMRAHAVLRCVQEIITNVIRHASAEHLWIELTRTDGGIAIRAKDDGRGAKELRFRTRLDWHAGAAGTAWGNAEDRNPASQRVSTRGLDARLRRPRMIRVCLVEDQTLVRQGIKTLLELVDDIDVVGEAKDGDEALRVIPETKPNVVLLDMYLPKRNGLEVMKELKQSESLPPTLILTTFDEDKFIIGGLQAGAKGYLLKDVSLAQLTSAIRTLAGGGTLVHPAITQRLLNNIDRIRCDFPSVETPERLTWREIEILRLVARGYSNREIAEALTIAEGTVKNYVSSILWKMGVRDRTRAVLKALEAGYL